MALSDTTDKVAYFGHDRTDSKVISRIEQLQRLGFQVFGLTFHRVKFNRDHEPAWENVNLGVTSDYAYVQRFKSLLTGAVRILRHRRHLANVDFIFARNIDMALLALFGRLIAGSRAPIAYEVLDVHRFFLGKRRRHRLFRAIERWVLARCDALIVSSEGYMRHYFQPIQKFKGRWFLLENKVPVGCVRMPAGPPVHRPKELGRPWVIGWCGTMRCVYSLRLLIEIARRHRDTVQIHMRGYPTETGLEAYKAMIEGEPNMIYGGVYKGPEDLAEVYAEVDLNWTIELWDHSYNSKNSHWLLPNRLYEGGCFHVPMIAMANTETAQRVEQLDGGWVLQEPLVEQVSRLLENLTVEAYQAKRANLKAAAPSTFWEIDDLEEVCNQLRALRAPDRQALVSA